MNQNPSLGMNKTGTAASLRCQEMRAGIEDLITTTQGNSQSVAQVRVAYALEAKEIGTGSVPPPLSVKGALSSAATALTGGSPVLLMDKLGQRLGFERAGVRFYEAVLSKYDAFGSFSGGPSREDLEHLLEEELAHFALLMGVIEQLGGDPTALGPSGNLQGNSMLGVNQILADPRVTLLQSLDAMLIAELTDNESWAMLSDLARDAGQRELVTQFQQALRTEQQHLAKVRAWVKAGCGLAQETDGHRGLSSDDQSGNGHTQA